MKPYACVAITGGIGEGKSTVLGYLAEQGYRTGSSDEAAKQVFADERVQQKLAHLIGQELPLDRSKLREAIASTPGIRRQVNRIMHPRILARLMQGSPQFVEVPLLIEACLHPLFERVWVVTCGVEAQRQRLLQRYNDSAHVQQLLGTQLSSLVKSAFADAIVRTNAPEDAVKGFVSEVAIREMSVRGA